MSERSKLINYKGKEILFFDYKDLAGEDYLKEIDNAKRITGELISSGKTDILIFIDAANSVHDTKIWKAMLDNVEFSDKRIKGIAITGVEGIKRNLLHNTTNKLLNQSAFDSSKDAKDWLVSL